MSKEIKWKTGGYDQQVLNDWWKMVGYPGDALTVPDFLAHGMVGAGRDVFGVYLPYTNPETGKTKLIRAKIGDPTKNDGKHLYVTKEQAQAANKFRGDLAHFTDPFREQSGISKVAGGILDVAKVAFPALGFMSKVADAGNKALGNNDPPDPKELQAIVEANHAASGAPGGAAAAAGTTVIPPLAYKREQTGAPTNPLRYGFGPEQKFFKTVAPDPATPAPAPVPAPAPGPVGAPGGGGLNLSDLIGRILEHKQGHARGGSIPRSSVLNRVAQRATGGSYVAHGTGAGGRDDNIDAKLSENEYVIDAETVALLGDGSPEAGAKKLDQMRESIRRHKGGALAKGEISPDAKSSPLQYLADGGKALRPRQSLSQAMDAQDADFDRWRRLPHRERKAAIPAYAARERIRVGETNYDLPPLRRMAKLAEGGKVGVLSKLIQRMKPQDPNAGLKRIRDMLDAELARPKKEITPLDMTEHFDNVMRIRDAAKPPRLELVKGDK